LVFCVTLSVGLCQQECECGYRQITGVPRQHAFKLVDHHQRRRQRDPRIPSYSLTIARPLTTTTCPPTRGCSTWRRTQTTSRCSFAQALSLPMRRCWTSGMVSPMSPHARVSVVALTSVHVSTHGLGRYAARKAAARGCREDLAAGWPLRHYKRQ
jgi:hypothetical protein